MGGLALGVYWNVWAKVPSAAGETVVAAMSWWLSLIT